MISLENISSHNGDEVLFNNLNNSFETGRVHGIWNETDTANTRFLQLLTGDIPLSSGIIRYEGERLDHADVVYYNRAGMPSQDLKNEPLPDQYKNKSVYLFDNIFNPADMRSSLHFYKIILPLKNMGRTILITSTDYKALSVSTDFFHIFSQGVFQARLDPLQYYLLDDVFRHLQR